MKLREYLEEKNMSVAEMADKLGLHTNYLFMLMRGDRRPSLTLAKLIQTVTENKVTVEEIMPPRQEPVVCQTCGKKLSRYYTKH